MKLKHLLEHKIPKITNPQEAYEYAVEQEKRIPELEPLIMEDPHCTYWYAKKVIKGRWPEAEPIIIKDIQYICWYAIYVIKGRWPEAEHTLKQYLEEWEKYVHHFPEAEPRTKDIPLVLGEYKVMDIPNTITDEQLVRLIQLKYSEVFSLTSSDKLFECINLYRTYTKAIIQQRLSRLKPIEILKSNNQEKVHKMFKYIDIISYNESDFD